MPGLQVFDDTVCLRPARLTGVLSRSFLPGILPLSVLPTNMGLSVTSNLKNVVFLGLLHLNISWRTKQKEARHTFWMRGIVEYLIFLILLDYFPVIPYIARLVRCVKSKVLVEAVFDCLILYSPENRTGSPIGSHSHTINIDFFGECFRKWWIMRVKPWSWNIEYDVFRWWYSR